MRNLQIDSKNNKIKIKINLIYSNSNNNSSFKIIKILLKIIRKILNKQF